MDKLIIPFDNRKESDIDGGGVVTFIGWERLRKALEPIVDCDENEKIMGFTVDKTGITIKLETVI